MKAPQYTLEDVLAAYPPNENPFLAIANGISTEIRKQPAASVKHAMYGMLAVLGTVCIANIVALGTRFYRGERWLYKTSDLSQGRLIVPNTIINFLVYNIAFVLVCFPYILLSALKLGKNLHNVSYWMCFTFIAIFLGLWHVAWGTVASAIMQKARITHMQRSRFTVPSWLVNAFFISGIITCIPAMIGTTAVAADRWNLGYNAMVSLVDSLTVKASEWAAVDGSSADTVRKAIPNADFLLTQITKGFYRYENPWYVCAAYALIAGIIMAIACVVQISALRDQMKPDVVPGGVDVFGQKTNSSSKTTASFRDPKLTRMFQNVVMTTVTLCFAMFAYFAVCFIGNITMKRAGVFKITKSNSAHMQLIMYAYVALDVLAIGAILYQTFDKETVKRAGNSTNSKKSVISDFKKSQLASKKSSTRNSAGFENSTIGSLSTKGDIESLGENTGTWADLTQMPSAKVVAYFGSKPNKEEVFPIDDEIPK